MSQVRFKGSTASTSDRITDTVVLYDEPKEERNGMNVVIACATFCEEMVSARMANPFVAANLPLTTVVDTKSYTH